MTATRLEPAEPLRGSGVALERAILDSLDDLEGALRLETLGENEFRAGNEHSRFGRAFGGQLLAQAMLAAASTVDGQLPHSLHAYFVRSGDPEVPLHLSVERTRDGRSMSTRQVTVRQAGREILTAIASFHANPAEPELFEAPSGEVRPEELPLLQQWVAYAPEAMRPTARKWIDMPPPVEMRIGEAPTFVVPGRDSGVRAHWMRLPRGIGDRPVAHIAMLAYASDYLLLDMAFRNHPEPVDHRGFVGLSLDHSIWVHRAVRFDEWHRYTQRIGAVSGHRALVHGTLHDLAGHLVASTAQEVLVRPVPR
ncbi:acyl-CoA thioesterase [Nocardia aurantia]|uniref:Acyl-CoA thioesterase 2 n=1 Tax=Nocardia aurantia TaxID=2585199 RepID=A0A7K0DQZ5_9NOCA|nr:acyl-CoA thioesterase domain-containing protein [Nocardia aurantia]MQY28141.1 Acyl-CoA thioesterase 2 [Nocardia aurantia]